MTPILPVDIGFASVGGQCPPYFRMNFDLCGGGDGGGYSFEDLVDFFCRYVEGEAEAYGVVAAGEGY